MTMFELILVGGILFFIFSLLWIKQISLEKKCFIKRYFSNTITFIIIVHTVILDMAFERKRISNEAIIVENRMLNPVHF